MTKLKKVLIGLIALGLALSLTKGAWGAEVRIKAMTYTLSCLIHKENCLTATAYLVLDSVYARIPT